MDTSSLNPTELVRVASFNLHSNPDLYHERVAGVLKESHERNVDILLIQELLASEKEAVIESFTNAGYVHSFVSEASANKKIDSESSSTAVFSKLPVELSRSLNMTALSGAQKAATAVLHVNGHEVHVISVHLAWGAENSFLRLRQSMLLADYARRAKDKNENVIVIAGGTFNDLADGDSVRYLKGRKASDDTQSTYWVDVAENTELESKDTTRHGSHWGVISSERTGILVPSAVPERRADYLFVHGWIYGRAGMPLEPELFGVSKTVQGYELSDHYGVQSLIWLPNKF